MTLPTKRKRSGVIKTRSFKKNSLEVEAKKALIRYIESHEPKKALIRYIESHEIDAWAFELAGGFSHTVKGSTKRPRKRSEATAFIAYNVDDVKKILHFYEMFKGVLTLKKSANH